MHDFRELCHALKRAVSLEEAPQFVIKPELGFQDPHNVQGKLKYMHEKSAAKLEKHKRYQLSCKGSCSIDKFAGFELLKIFCNILDKPDIRRPGNYLCFLIDDEVRAAIIIYNAVSCTAQISNENGKLRRMFTKLFDDDEIEKQRNDHPETSHLYLQEDINRYRLQAKDELPNFLRQKFSDFLDRNEDNFMQMPLWNSFFGLLVNIAKRTSKHGNLNSVSSYVPRIGCIPYLACVKFAFDNNRSGKITELFGEIGSQETSNKFTLNRRQAQCIVKTAEDLISLAIPAHNDEEWDEEQVEKVVDEVSRFYLQ